MHQTAPASRYHLPDLAARPPGRPRSGLARAIGRGVARGIGRSVRALQYGRMIGVLEQLPDHQLARIGVTRAQIPAYARHLIYGDAAA